MAEEQSIISEEPIPVLVQIKTLKNLPLGSIRHMSCLRDDQVWVSDNHGNLVLTDSKGSKLDKIEVDIFADDGFQAVTGDGDLLFTDETHKLIKKVSVDKKIEVIIRTDQWTPVSVFCSLVTGKVFVSLRREEYRFTKEGKAKVEQYSKTYNLLSIIKTENQGHDLYGEPLYITENINGDICVSDWKRRAVIVVDSIGRHKFLYSGQQTDPHFYPSGLSPDTHGRLVIYNSQTRTVHLIDMNGNFLSFLLDSIPFPHPLCFKVAGPIGLCWDKKCNLWIGEYTENSLTIYSYRLN